MSFLELQFTEESLVLLVYIVFLITFIIRNHEVCFNEFDSCNFYVFSIIIVQWLSVLVRDL